VAQKDSTRSGVVVSKGSNYFYTHAMPPASELAVSNAFFLPWENLSLFFGKSLMRETGVSDEGVTQQTALFLFVLL
jgi:hypothetical protein